MLISSASAYAAPNDPTDALIERLENEIHEVITRFYEPGSEKKDFLARLKELNIQLSDAINNKNELASAPDSEAKIEPEVVVQPDPDPDPQPIIEEEEEEEIVVQPDPEPIIIEEEEKPVATAKEEEEIIEEKKEKEPELQQLTIIEEEEPTAFIPEEKEEPITLAGTEAVGTFYEDHISDGTNFFRYGLWLTDVDRTDDENSRIDFLSRSARSNHLLSRSANERGRRIGGDGGEFIQGSYEFPRPRRSTTVRYYNEEGFHGLYNYNGVKGTVIAPVEILVQFHPELNPTLKGIIGKDLTLEGDKLGGLIIGEGIHTRHGEFQENSVFFGTWEGMGNSDKGPVTTLATFSTNFYGTGTIKGSFTDDGNNVRYPKGVAGEVIVSQFALEDGETHRFTNELVGVFYASTPSRSHTFPNSSATYSGSLHGTTLSSHAHPGKSVRADVSLQYNFQADTMSLEVKSLNLHDRPSRENGGFPATISYEASCLSQTCSGDFSVTAGVNGVYGNVSDSTHNYRGDFTAIRN